MRRFRYAGYLAALALGTLLVLGGVFAFNAWKDPQADFLFLTGWNPHPIDRIDNYCDAKFKVGLLKALPSGSVDAAVFGSSRTLRIDPDSPGFGEIGKNTFNLAVQGARLPTIKAFVSLARSKNPSMISVVALDFFSFGKDDGVPSLYLDSRRSWQAAWDAVVRLLDIRTLKESLAFPASSSRHRLMLNGRDIMKISEEEREKLPGYLENFCRKQLSEIQTYKGFDYDPGRIAELRAFREQCGPMIFFLNPESRWYLEPLRRSELWPVYLKWKSDLKELGGVIDFSETPEITENMEMYFDEHHYLDNAGRLIMEDVANAHAGRPLKHGRILTKDSPSR